MTLLNPLKRVFCERKLELFAPIPKLGKDYDNACGDFITYPSLSEDDGKSEWFASKETIIIGVNPTPNGMERGGYVEWHFDISKLPKSLISANLKVTTFRTHGGLHTTPEIAEQAIQKGKPKTGKVFINGELADRIDLMKPMPHGRDYGFNWVEPYPIIHCIKECKEHRQHELIIKLEVDPQVYWDVDVVSLEGLVNEAYPFRQWFWIFLGAVLSVIFTFLAHYSYSKSHLFL